MAWNRPMLPFFRRRRNRKTSSTLSCWLPVSFRPILVVLEERMVPTTFTVTNTGDNGGINPIPGGNTGTFRQAIVDANADTFADVITFNIAPGGLQTINVLDALPTIIQSVTIDGTSQPLFAGSPLIE